MHVTKRDVGLHIWAAVGSDAPHCSPKEHEAVGHWAVVPHPIIPAHPTPLSHRTPQHAPLLSEAAHSDVLLLLPGIPNPPELPREACFGRAPGLNKQPRARRRYRVWGRIVNVAFPSALPWPGEPRWVLGAAGLPRPLSHPQEPHTQHWGVGPCSPRAAPRGGEGQGHGQHPAHEDMWLLPVPSAAPDSGRIHFSSDTNI